MSNVKVVSVDQSTLAVTLDVDGQNVVATPFAWGSKMLMKVNGQLDRGTRISCGARAKAAIKKAGLTLPVATPKRPRKPKEEATTAPAASGSVARDIPIAASGEALVPEELLDTPEAEVEASEALAVDDSGEDVGEPEVVTARPGQRIRLDFEGMDVDTLRGLCKARGIRGYSDKKKADLIALLDGVADVAEAA